ncbi:DUF2423 domain-containing protein [Aspergillus candidus]|uniref:DUF2423 domain-containing protein n=1 Tax=Aspergillus candidus TaxID=41067 RepID=A0A2I2F1L8_ASPCN|nr:hypothetical protein BDW47DRAFT_112204 [Aspergillus candidus]PLB34496.1 hypothetical protein BDW47DRAFT_112204 [Aspergillus candidus]
MAKSVRASVSKRNKAKLRATVFGPVVDARTERLSAKLQELASQPKTNEHEKSDVGSDTAGIDEQSGASGLSEYNEDMDLDKASEKKTSSQKSGRIHKRHSNRKNRSSITFTPRFQKSRKVSKRK